MSAPAAHLLIHPSGEIHTKSKRTRRRFLGLLARRIGEALGEVGRLEMQHQRLRVFVDDPTAESLAAAAGRCAHVFGVQKVSAVQPLPFGDLEELAAKVGERARDRVIGRTFAVRVKRRGRHEWSSEQANREIGGQLFGEARGVDLERPEVTVSVDVHQDVAHLVDRTWDGPAGLPAGAQERCLALLSGGFDSPVAAWMMMRRGCPVDLVHFKLECSASEHATLVAWELWRRWGGGHDPLLWMVDFQPAKEALLEHVDSRVRQVVLKQLMVGVSDALARRLGIHALITGESVGQVSSQTLSHLAAIDRYATRAVIRPVAAMLKDEIISWSRRIGTEALSARAKEVCDLSEGPVAVSARWKQLEEAHEGLPDDLIALALEHVEVIALGDWMPGVPWVPVHSDVPEGRIRVSPREAERAEGALAIRGSGSARVASRLHAQGRDVSVVLHP